MKAAVAEIQVIREAAVQFKHNDGGGKYNNMTLATFGSYLGDGVAQDRDMAPQGVLLTNTFGEYLLLISDVLVNGENLQLLSYGIPNLNVCKQILEHFGEVAEGSGTDTFYIPAGKSIFGYVGSPSEHASGCIYNGLLGKASLTLRID